MVRQQLHGLNIDDFAIDAKSRSRYSIDLYFILATLWQTSKAPGILCFYKAGRASFLVS